MNKTIEVTRDLKDMIISALRYALGRKTYITDLTADFIMNNPELIDERVKKIMVQDLEEYFTLRNKNFYRDDKCDYDSWKSLYEWLVKYENR